MDNMRIIYKILKALERAMDAEEFDVDLISPEVLGITKERRDRLLIELQDNGYISGILHKQYIRQGNDIITNVSPKITLKGLEYLEDNSTMKKVADTLKDVINVASAIK